MKKKELMKRIVGRCYGGNDDSDHDSIECVLRRIVELF